MPDNLSHINLSGHIGLISNGSHRIAVRMRELPDCIRPRIRPINLTTMRGGATVRDM